MCSNQGNAKFDTVKKRGPCSRNESSCGYKVRSPVVVQERILVKVFLLCSLVEF